MVDEPPLPPAAVGEPLAPAAPLPPPAETVGEPLAPAIGDEPPVAPGTVGESLAPDVGPPPPPDAGPPPPPGQPTTAKRSRRPLVLGVAGGAVVVVIIVVVLVVSGHKGAKPSTEIFLPPVPPQSTAAPQSSAAPLSSAALTAPATIGQFQLQSPTATTLVADPNTFLRRYLRPGTTSQVVQFSATRVLDPQGVAQFLQTQVNADRGLFDPGVSVTTVTNGGVQYTCLAGTLAGSGGKLPVTACNWGADPLVFNLVGAGQGLDQAAVLALAPAAQAGTGS
jgi:hypothetical protein